MSSKRVIIIGGGPGGYVAAIRAAQLGAKVILIEKNRIGGTCLNRGCIPTKALLSDAKLLRSLRHSPVFQSILREGFEPLEAMMDRKAKVVQEMVKGVELLLESQRVAVKHGEAALLDVDTVALLCPGKEQETFEGDAIILAPGSKSKALLDISPDEESILSSDGILELKRIPRDLVVIGGGYIGVEFASLFHMLGSKVTIVEVLDEIMPGLEPEMVRNLRRVLEREGVRILTRSRVEEVHPGDGGLRLTLRTPLGIEEALAEKLLLAVGRAPNLDLNFSKAGVEISPAGIRVNNRMETTTPHIYAVGDAVGGLLLAHVAQEQGVIASENAMGIDREMEDGPIPLCIFSYPEIASIGLTEKEARAKGDVKIGRFPFRSSSKALISGETDGLVKVVASRETDAILGVHIIGPEASTLISTVSCFLNQRGGSKDFCRFVQAHPTLPEAMKEAVLDVDGVAIHLPRPLVGHKK